MASGELQRLWKLAEIDRQLLEVRKRAASLNVGQKIQGEIAELQAEEAEVGGKARALQREITDLELAQKGDEEKKKRFHNELYGGKVVNPREVANIEKEIESIKKKQDSDAEKLLLLYDQLPPAKKAADAVQAKIDERQKALAEQRKKAIAEKQTLENAFKQLTAKRPEAAKGLSPSLLARYDAIRQKQNGIGMVEVDKKTGTCSGCGTHLPERTLTFLKEDKVATCESCHRLLYYTEGVI
ncbi:MAG TPA: C4-type zinc ribbon domain-containing protein [Fimbriimonas sp.]|nr:C4-type zinc ribbon domain-containing protein [Fimbriimonas sp.]